MKRSAVVKNLASKFFLRPTAGVEASPAALGVHIKPARFSEFSVATSRRVNSLRRWGYILFTLSFVTPDLALDGTGIGAFLLAPVGASFAVSHALSTASWPAALLGTLLLLAWLDNATIFFNLPGSLTGLAIVAPWCLFLVLLFRSPDSVLDPQIATFAPFYLWAIGIALIHGPRWVERYGYEEGSTAFLYRRAAILRRAA